MRHIITVAALVPLLVVSVVTPAQAQEVNVSLHPLGPFSNLVASSEGDIATPLAGLVVGLELPPYFVLEGGGFTELSWVGHGTHMVLDAGPGLRHAPKNRGHTVLVANRLERANSPPVVDWTAAELLDQDGAPSVSGHRAVAPGQRPKGRRRPRSEGLAEGKRLGRRVQHPDHARISVYRYRAGPRTGPR